MRRQFLLLVCFISLLLSCGKSNKFNNEDYEWMPYEGYETLVFRSNAGDTDTIFLLKKDTLKAYPEAQAPNGTEYEVLSIFCRHSDPNSPGESHQYLENDFFRIEKGKDNRAALKIYFEAKDANFYRLNSIRIDSLLKIKPSTLQTRTGQYNDVYEINGEDYLGNFSRRSNFITKVYWSKSQGLIRYDKTGDTYWELERKY